MPIDTSIYGIQKQPQFENPLDLYGKTLQIQNAMQQQKLGQQQLQSGNLELVQKRTDMDQSAQLRKVLAEAPDLDTAIPLVMKINPSVGISLQKSALEGKKAQLEMGLKKTEALGSIAGSITDENTFHSGIAQALGMGLIDKNAADQLLSAGFQQSQPQIKQFQTRAMSSKDQHAAEIADAELKLKNLEDQRKAAKEEREADEVINNQAAYDAALHGLPAEVKAALPAKFSPTALDRLKAATLTKEQQTQADQSKASADENKRHNLTAEATAKLQSSVAAGRLAQEQTVNGMKYGPGTTEYWVKQLQDNPDSIKEMPPELRSNVGKGFTAATGLPLPTAANAAAITQETAARNALDGASFIQNALRNPEIRANIGPIMGRLGNAEQSLGTSLHLSPEAAKLAQELRTRMRYFVFQEGKAVLGGRLPQQLMKELEASSPNPKMDPDTLEGALNGAAGNAKDVMKNVDAQRFGGKSRGSSGSQQSSGPAAGAVESGYKFKGGDPSKPENWEKVR